jgi:hypothetical protein
MTDVPTSRRLLRKFLLQDAESFSRRLSDSERQQLREQVARARQKVESAKVLWSSEQYVEGLRLAEEGIVESLRAVDLAGVAWPEGAMGASPQADAAPHGSGSGWQAVLARLGAPSEELSHARAALAGPGSARPALNDEVSPQHRLYCRSAVWVAETALGRISRLALPPARIVLSRFLRVGALAALLVAVVAGALAMRGRISVKASAHYSDPRFAAGQATDGNPKTEWILPSRTAGWIEVGFGKRDLSAVKLLNSLNPPHNDRGAKNVRIECLRGKALVQSANYAFAAFTPNPVWVRVPLACKGVDTLRVWIDTWHLTGGGLAELAWE